MGYLAASIVASFAMSLSVFDASGSILLAFIAYSLTGTVVLLAALLAEAETITDQSELPAAD